MTVDDLIWDLQMCHDGDAEVLIYDEEKNKTYKIKAFDASRRSGRSVIYLDKGDVLEDEE
jgi:hypothetical protein